MSVVKVSSKGQIVLPKKLRDDLGIKEGDRLEVSRQGDQLVIKISTAAETSDWRSWRGVLAGSGSLEAHLAEHREEIRR